MEAGASDPGRTEGQCPARLEWGQENHSPWCVCHRVTLDHCGSASQLMTCMIRQNPPSAGLQKNGWWTRRLCCSSQEPCQDGEMGRQGSHKLQQREMQSPVAGPLSDTKLSVIQQGSRPGFFRQSFTRRLREMILPLYSSLVRQTWSTGPVLGLSTKDWSSSCKQLLSD